MIYNGSVKEGHHQDPWLRLKVEEPLRIETEHDHVRAVAGVFN